MIYLDLYVAPLLLYLMKQKNYTVNTKTPKFPPTIPLRQKTLDICAFKILHLKCSCSKER